jgi:hypothetical protein
MKQTQTARIVEMGEFRWLGRTVPERKYDKENGYRSICLFMVDELWIAFVYRIRMAISKSKKYNARVMLEQLHDANPCMSNATPATSMVVNKCEPNFTCTTI